LKYTCRFWSWNGPTFQQINPNGAILVNEAQFVLPTFEDYEIEDNDVSQNPPTFNILGTTIGPNTITPIPTPPDILQFVSWPNAFPVAFNYTVNPALNIANVGLGANDSAVNYFYGPDSDTSITVPTGTNILLSASLIPAAAVVVRGIPF
jgi:hypothetical protein